MSSPVRFLAFALAATLITTLGRPAPAAAARDDEDVVSKMTPKKMEAILDSMEDFEVKKINEKTYGVVASELKFGIINYGNALQTLARFTGYKVSQSKVNEWNKSKRFSRVYLDKDGNAIIESDLLLVGGVTEANIKEWLKLYVLSLKAFRDFIEE